MRYFLKDIISQNTFSFHYNWLCCTTSIIEGTILQCNKDKTARILSTVSNLTIFLNFLTLYDKISKLYSFTKDPRFYIIGFVAHPSALSMYMYIVPVFPFWNTYQAKGQQLQK